MDTTNETIKNISKELDFIGEISTGDKLKKIETIPFGIPSLDFVSGGVPRGLPTEIYGNPSCGKSSLCLRLVSEAQRAGIKCLYIDAEMAMTPALMEKNGVDIKTLVVARPIDGEDTFELIEAFSEKGYGLIVVDSVSSLVPATELENDYDQDTIALQARMMSRGFRKITGLIHRTNTAVVFINQLREKMARMPGAKTTTTSGGRALPYYAGLRLEVVRIGWIEKDKIREGMRVKIHTEKNKLHTPQRSVEVDFLFESGFSVSVDLLSHLVKIGEVKEVGRTFYWKDKSIGTKLDAAKYLLDNYKTVQEK